MPPVFQQSPLRVPPGPPKAALRIPEGAPRAPRVAQGVPQELLGDPLPPQPPPQDPPRSTFDCPRGISENIRFTIVKPTFSRREGPESIGVLPFGCSCGTFFSSSASPG